MSNRKIVRIRTNPNSLLKIAVIVSNSVMLTANAYLIGSSFRNHYRVRQQERISNNLQTTAEIAAALAGITKVITASIGGHHAETG